MAKDKDTRTPRARPSLPALQTDRRKSPIVARGPHALATSSSDRPLPPSDGATDGDLDHQSLLVLRTLLQAERLWSAYYRRLGDVGPRADMERARDVARVLRATSGAILQGNDDELRTLGGCARKSLGRMRERQSITKHEEDRKGRHMVEVGPGIMEFALCFGLNDVEPSRAEALMVLRSTLSLWIMRGGSADDLVTVFLQSVRKGVLLRYFTNEDVDTNNPTGEGQVRKAFASMDPPRSERLIIQGAKALGLSKDKAESLFDFDDKRTERGGGTFE